MLELFVNHINLILSKRTKKKKNNFRSEGGSQIRYGYRKRKPSVHVSQNSSQDVSTQTECNKLPSKFARTFSIISSGLGTSSTTQHAIKHLEVNDEVQQLIDCCRRYQV